LSVESLILIIAEDHLTLKKEERAAAIFMNSASQAEHLRSKALSHPARSKPDQLRMPRISRLFHPIERSILQMRVVRPCRGRKNDLC
jgi:hypothetical protein